MTRVGLSGRCASIRRSTRLTGRRPLPVKRRPNGPSALCLPYPGHRGDEYRSGVETFRLIGSRGFAFDEEYLRDLAGRSWDRGYEPAGSRRQLAATANQPNRTAALRRITVPTLVIHGLHDPLVAPSGGLAIARAIPNSRFVGFSGMGHDLPRALWPEFVREIAALARLGEQRRQGPPAG